jgi:transcriptional regulator with XRE-family HTH domain
MQDPHGDLAVLLRSWRDRLSPTDVGLPAGPARRASGLRREELAALAGLSVDYVIRLEQGRARNPSGQVVASLARALQLSDVERGHLYRVSGLLAPMPGTVPSHIPPSVQRLVARLGEAPLAVFSASWDLLTWSPLWAALLGEPIRTASERANLLRAHFVSGSLSPLGDCVVERSGRADAFGASLVADLRRVRGRYPDDASVSTLVDDLLESSAEFARLWESGAVDEHQSETKVIRNPIVGDVALDCDVFSVAGSDLRIVIYTAAAGSPAAEKLDFLRVSAVTAEAASGR